MQKLGMQIPLALIRGFELKTHGDVGTTLFHSSEYHRVIVVVCINV